MLQGKEKDRKQRAPAQSAVSDFRKQPSDTKDLTLHVIGDRERFSALVRTLEGQGFRLLDELDDLGSVLRADAAGSTVVVYPNPVLFIGEMLKAGESTNRALNTWRETTEQLLSRFRQDRRRLTLLDGHAAQAGPELLHRLLADRLPRSVNATGTAEGLQADSEPAGLFELVAAQALRQDETAAALVAELEASSLPLLRAYSIDVDAVLASGLPGTDTSDLDELREENELLFLQLHQVQEELEAHFLENQKKNNDLSNLKAEVYKARGDAKTARDGRDESQAEFVEARETWEADREALASQLEWHAATLTAVRRSLSWRLTAPVRRLLGLFIGDSKI